jgi:hypothetical protein
MCVFVFRNDQGGIRLNKREKKTHWEEEKTLAKLASKLKKITRQFQIPLAFGELASGYPHPGVKRSSP